MSTHALGEGLVALPLQLGLRRSGLSEDRAGAERLRRVPEIGVGCLLRSNVPISDISAREFQILSI